REHPMVARHSAVRRRGVEFARLVELFKLAMPAERALHTRELTAKQTEKAHETIYAFEKAAGCVPWEDSPLSSYATGHWFELRQELLKAIDDEDGQDVASPNGGRLARRAQRDRKAAREGR